IKHNTPLQNTINDTLSSSECAVLYFVKDIRQFIKHKIVLVIRSFPGPGCLDENVQGCEASLSLSFFKISFGLPHLICDVRETNDLVLFYLCQCIESCCLHFHCKNAFLAARLYHLLCFSKGCIGCPTCSYIKRNMCVVPCGINSHVP